MASRNEWELMLEDYLHTMLKMGTAVTRRRSHQKIDGTQSQEN